MATAPRNTVRWSTNLEMGPFNVGPKPYGATAPISPIPSPVANIESPRNSNNNISIPVGFVSKRKTRAQRRRERKQRRQRKTRRNRRNSRR